MNRNVESRFAYNPTSLDMSRSRFTRESSVKTSFNVGDVIPFYVDEVLPGDTFNIETSKVVRMQTLLAPIMDNVYLDTYYFFVPNRLVWEHWKEFMGENTQSAWIPTTEYEVPVINSPSGGWNVGTIADYMGIPTGVDNISVNALPIRGYSLIMDSWFRDENLTDPLSIPTDETTVTGVNTGDYVTDTAKGGLPFKASKYHDYFTSALPSPQKGPDVTIQAVGGTYPVVTSTELNDFSLYPTYSRNIGSTPYQMKFPMILGSSNTIGGFDDTDKVLYGAGTSVSWEDKDSTASGSNYPLAPLNLVTTLGNTTVATVNQLRLAFQIQKLYEKDARGGTRYIELLKSHFGVTSPDARLQRPEYLGGNRIPININQVVQTSGTQADTTPLADTGAYSLTTDKQDSFIKSFVEHGFVIGVMVARYDHTYQQGLERFWSRKDRFDYYWPVLANIGEQAILNKEIYAQGTDEDNEVFGYQEAWADYRYKPSRVTGEMRSQYAQSLDVWHLADDYSSLPALSDSWIREDKTNLDRSLAVQSSVSNQLFADIFIRNKATRPMPLYSIPGLIDHH